MWQVIHHSYNTAQNRLINLQLLDKILSHQQAEWLPFFKVEFINAINKYSSSSTLDPDWIFWSYLKALVNNDKYLTNFINIANSCIDLSNWSSHFKKSMLIIIPKPNKPSYDTSKIFQLIILLNTIEKLIKNVISGRQVYSITSSFIYPNQIGGIR